MKSFKKILFLISLFITCLSFGQVTIGNCNTGGVTATGGYTDFTDADNNYASGQYDFSPSVTNQTITTYHLVNSGTTGSIGFDISHHSANTNSGTTGCISNAQRTAVLYPVGGCNGTAISPTLGANNNTFYNPEFLNLTPNTDYILVVTTTAVTSCNVDQMWVTYYSIASNNTSSCGTDIGTFSMQKNGSSTSNTTSYDLLPNETFTITANGDATLPTPGVDNEQSGVGYAAFSCDPSSYALSDPTKYNTTDMPCFLGFHYSSSMTDENNTNSQVNGLNLTSWWFVPVTFDDVCSPSKASSPCKNGTQTNIGIDTDGDGCFANGNPIQINYITSPPVGCTTCSSTLCTSSSVTDTDITAARAALTTQLSNDGDQYNTTVINAGESVTICVPVTVPANTSILGFKQRAFGSPGGCTNPSEQVITYELRPIGCGNVIAPNRTNAQPVSSGFNPEWDNPAAGDYTLCYTATNDQLALCNTFEIDGIGYYTVTTSSPACPTDQSFITLDWTQNNPFITYPNNPTFTCNDGPQDIWKNIDDATIATGGELQAYPGFFVELVTNNNSATRTSALVTVNGTPYSYYGPTGTAPANVLDWGPMAVPPNYQNILEPYIPAGATVQIDICDTRNSAQSFQYTIWDYSTGSILTSGTASPSNGNCTTITFTLASPTMTWDIDGNQSLITDNNNGSATFDPSNLTAGQHTITYTYNNNLGCTITATQTITVGAKPNAPTTSPVTYCQNATASALTATATNGNTLKWYTTATGGTGSNTAPTPSTSTATTISYWVTQTDNNGCESPRAQLDVTINPILTTTVTCGTSTQSSVTFNWTSVTGATGYNLSYTVNGGTAQTVNNVNAISYQVTGLSGGDVVAVTVTPVGTGCYTAANGSCIAQSCTPPTINTQPTATADCEGSNLTLTVAASNATGYQWQISTNGGGSWSNVSNSGVYSGATTTSLAISDNTGLDTYQYQVIVNETTGNCPVTSNPVTLSVTPYTTTNISCGTPTDTSVTFNWNSPNGATDFDISYTINGGSLINGGNQSSTGYTVSGLSVGDIVIITVTSNGTNCYTDAQGTCEPTCVKPTVSFLPDPLNMTTVNTTTDILNNTTNANSYSWDFGDGTTSTDVSPSHTYSDLDTGKYTIKLIAYGNGNCVDSLTKIVRVYEDLIYYIPNTFTPFDKNDYNPVFKPVFYSGFETRNYSMEIFDRWGTLIYSTTNIDEGWNGKDQNTNRICQDGTYVYKIQFGVKSYDDRKIVTGHVNLLR